VLLIIWYLTEVHTRRCMDVSSLLSEAGSRPVCWI
jgi:hypothetical protein